MSAVTVTLLGTFAVAEEGIDRHLPAAAQRLVALVALRRRPLHREHVTSTLWPHLRTPAAAASLRSTLSRLRSVLPHLMATGDGDLRLGDAVGVDVDEFEDAATRVLDGGADGDTPSAERFALDLLTGWQDEWVLFERERLREVGLHAIEAQAMQFAAHRQFVRAITAAYTAIRLDPLRESAARTLVEIHLAEGNRAQAARCYLDYRRRLLSALRMEPSDEMRAFIATLVAEPRYR